jgi:hypothetical protein
VVVRAGCTSTLDSPKILRKHSKPILSAKSCLRLIAGADLEPMVRFFED